jgi:hypothetical protein
MMRFFLARTPPFLFAMIFAVAVGCGGQVSEQPTTEPQPEPSSRFGMNLATMTDWTTEWPLVDVFKTSRAWIAKGEGEVAFDEQGNPRLKPGQSLTTLMVREIGGHYPAGVYTATYEGTGTVEMSRYDVKRVVKTGPGRIESDVVPGDGGLELTVTASDPKDPVRNVRVWMPTFEKAKSPFHPLFVERLQPFGVLRFMDWQRTNNSPLERWDRRAKPSDPRYTTEAGVPLELMIDLANTCKCDPWFCMPHRADDEFVRQFARTVRERLDRDRKIYIEYSNEVWNGVFSQSTWAREQGQKLKVGAPEATRLYSQRSIEIFKIWETVFDGTTQLVRVMGSQFANPDVSEQVLAWQDAARHTDALAVAPYFGYQFGDPKTAEQVAGMTPDALLDALAKDVEGPNREGMKKQVAVARKHHVRLIAYEGGQHLAAFAGAENNQTLTDLFIAANRHRRMDDLYRKHLTNWFAAGGDLYVVFNYAGKPNKWGSWGVLEYQDQPIESAPKYRAVVEIGKDRTRPDK